MLFSKKKEPEILSLIQQVEKNLKELDDPKSSPQSRNQIINKELPADNKPMRHQEAAEQERTAIEEKPKDTVVDKNLLALENYIESLKHVEFELVSPEKIKNDIRISSQNDLETIYIKQQEDISNEIEAAFSKIKNMNSEIEKINKNKSKK